MHDAGYSGQVHDRQIDQPREPIVAGVLVQIDGRQDTDRRVDQERDDGQEEGAHQRCPNAACGHTVRRVVEDKGRGEDRPRPNDEIAEDGDHGDDQQGRDHREERSSDPLAAYSAHFQRSGREGFSVRETGPPPGAQFQLTVLPHTPQAVQRRIDPQPRCRLGAVPAGAACLGIDKEVVVRFAPARFRAGAAAKDVRVPRLGVETVLGRILAELPAHAAEHFFERCCGISVIRPLSLARLRRWAVDDATGIGLTPPSHCESLSPPSPR